MTKAQNPSIRFVVAFLYNNYYTTRGPTIQPFHGPMDLVRDYPGEPVQKRKANQEGKTNLDLLEREIESRSGTSWVICKSAPRPDR